MDKHCRLTDERIVDLGDYTEAMVYTISGVELLDHAEFMEELALRIMSRYESQNYGDFLVLEDVTVEAPERTKQFYRRLFTQNGMPTADFTTEASETLCLWIEQALCPTICAEGNPPHSADPAWDVLSIFLDRGTPRLRVVQVKATQHSLQDNCNIALTGFKRVEDGHYAPQLLAKLRSMQRSGRLPDGVSARDLMYDGRKAYRITVMHNQDHQQLRMLTTYNQKIPGHRDRRSAHLVYVNRWSDFWKALAGAIYAKLT